MDNWHETLRVPIYRGPQIQPHYKLTSCLSFDNSQDILWSGSSDGYVTSFYSPSLRLYDSVHSQFNAPVSQIITNEKTVFALSPHSIKLLSRRGIIQDQIQNPTEFKSLSCMSLGREHATSPELLVGGNATNEILSLNLAAPGGSIGKEFTRIKLSDYGSTNIPHIGGDMSDPSAVKIVRTSHSLAVGKSNGVVDIIDTNSNQVVRSFKAHGGLISDMDAKETTLLTCGYSLRKNGLILDPLVNIYDLRAGKSRTPIAFPAGAGFVRLHPKLSTCAFIASQTGQIQLIDFANSASSQVRLHQATLSTSGVLTSFEVSPSGDFFALGEGSMIQLWNHSNIDSLADASFIERYSASVPLQFPVDPAAYILNTNTPATSLYPTPPMPIFDIDDYSAPLSSVGMPYYQDELLSNWRPEPSMPMIFDEGMPPSRLPPEVLSQIQDATTFGVLNSSTNSSALNGAIPNSNMLKNTPDIRKTAPEFGGIGVMGFFPPTPPSSNSSTEDPNNDSNQEEKVNKIRGNLAQKYVSILDLKKNTYRNAPKFISERQAISSRNRGGSNGASSTSSHPNLSSPNSAVEASGVYAKSSVETSFENNLDKATATKLETLMSSDLAEIQAGLIPQSYHRLEIKYSKFGIADFDFGYYNETKFSGLEPQFVNSYCNPLLQLYRYSMPIFEFALNNLKHNTLDEKSLLSELGLLFDMLNKAQGQHVAATNFVKTLSAIPQANALGLIVDDAHPINSFTNASLIHSSNASSNINLSSANSSNINNNISNNNSPAFQNIHQHHNHPNFANSSPAVDRRIENSNITNPGYFASGSAHNFDHTNMHHPNSAAGFVHQTVNNNNSRAGNAEEEDTIENVLVNLLGKLPSSNAIYRPKSEGMSSVLTNGSHHAVSSNPSILYSQGLLLQAFSRFLMERMAIDERAYDNTSHKFDDIAGIHLTTDVSYPSCSNKSSRDQVIYTLQLRAPVLDKQPIDPNIQKPNLFNTTKDPNSDTTSHDAFLQILQDSLEKKTTTRGFCNACHKYQSMVTTKTVYKLPEVLNLHVPLDVPFATTNPAKQNIPKNNTNAHPPPSSKNSSISATHGSSNLYYSPSNSSSHDSNSSSHTPLFIPSANNGGSYQQQQPPPGLHNFNNSQQGLMGYPSGGQHQQYEAPLFSPFISSKAPEFTNPLSGAAAHQYSQQQQQQPQLPQPYWRKERWPATEFAVQRSNVTKSDSSNEERFKYTVIPSKDYNQSRGDQKYELIGLVVHISANPSGGSSSAGSDSILSSPSKGSNKSASSSSNGQSLPGFECQQNNLIAFINVPIPPEDDPDTYKDNKDSSSVKEPKKQWHLFNDFLVKPVTESEVLNFSYLWKTPVVLLYQLVPPTPRPPFDFEAWKAELDTSILYRDHFSTGFRESAKREYELLDPLTEAPQPGTLVAIDTEFVLLQHEETEIISDGTKSLLRPKQMSLARVSVVRGQGPKEGVPFIDDFIETTDTIVDYLTEFSGIEPGDLDPWTSKRGGLVTLQTSYKRLWLLLNLGCVFIGHGLQNDFRAINIQVPNNQVADTLNLFYLPEYKRRLSLKFLIYALLDEKVQTGNHDSIEDAVSALKLFKVYQKINRLGPDTFTALLHKVYQEGKKYNFKPPPPSSNIPKPVELQKYIQSHIKE